MGLSQDPRLLSIILEDEDAGDSAELGETPSTLLANAQQAWPTTPGCGSRHEPAYQLDRPAGVP
jgi:hypothetical protein